MKQIIRWLVISIILSITSTMANANTNDAVIGPNDGLKITVYNNPDLTLETRVGTKGNITFPLIGEVKVSGLSAQQVETKIGGMLESGGFLKSAQVNVIVSDLQSQQISVLGQVAKPGRYPVDGKKSVMDMLALAGGLSPEAADSVNLIRKRDGQTTTEKINILDMVRSGNMNQDYVLTNDDVIFVERAPHFFIYGELGRPGMYKLERDMTAIQALSVGGGLTVRGTDRGMKIKRKNAEGQMEIIKAKHDDLLKPDDVVYVQESLF